MKKHEAGIFVFIASIIIGVLISTNIGLNKGTTRVFLNAKQYKDAYDTRNKLVRDISDLTDRCNEYTSKINSYKYGDKPRTQVLDELSKEIDDNSAIIGTTDVEGQGIKITMNDASNEFIEDPNDYELGIIHNTDIIQVLNDLKNSGAEAISINDQRVLDRTEVYCNGAFLRVNGVKIATPFNIYAIGDKEVIKNYMQLNENYLKSLILRNIDVNVEQIDNIKIPAYTGDLKYTYMKDIK
jgi:uncharacterized protein YlxW (UPF0749 family)